MIEEALLKCAFTSLPHMHKLIVVTLQNEAKNFSIVIKPPCQILGGRGENTSPPPSLYETLPWKDVAGIGILSSNDAICLKLSP